MGGKPRKNPNYVSSAAARKTRTDGINVLGEVI